MLVTVEVGRKEKRAYQNKAYFYNLSLPKGILKYDKVLVGDKT